MQPYVTTAPFVAMHAMAAHFLLGHPSAARGLVAHWPFAKHHALPLALCLTT